MKQYMSVVIDVLVNLVRSSVGRPMALANKAALRVQAADEF
jgi:hypothetical protein